MHFWLSEVLQLEDIFWVEDFLKKQVHFKNQSKQHGWGGSRVWKDEEAETVFISFVSISLSLPSLFTSHTHHTRKEWERKKDLDEGLEVGWVSEEVWW